MVEWDRYIYHTYSYIYRGVLQVGSLHSARWKAAKTLGIRDFLKSCHGMRISHQNLISFFTWDFEWFWQDSSDPAMEWWNGYTFSGNRLTEFFSRFFFGSELTPFCWEKKNLENKGGIASGCLNLVHFSSFNVCPCEARLSTEGDFAHVKNRAPLPWQVQTSWKVPLDGKYHGNLRVC